MPFKRSRKRRSRKGSTLSNSQRREVKKIAHKAIDAEIEDKSYVNSVENTQLFHDKPFYLGNIMSSIGQGVQDGDQGAGASGVRACRIGDQISLKNVNIRFWLSNKLDRPNVMYKCVLFWYPVGSTLDDAFVFSTQANKILDRYNTKQITIIRQWLLTSKEMYDNGTEKWEHSYIKSMDKSYKNKKITYNFNGQVTKDMELGFCLVAYDAFGTLPTDNIASFAYNYLLTFQDA